MCDLLLYVHIVLNHLVIKMIFFHFFYIRRFDILFQINLKLKINTQNMSHIKMDHGLEWHHNKNENTSNNKD